MAVVLSSLLTQHFRGRLAQMLRAPVVAVPGTALLIAWPLGVLGAFAAAQDQPLVNLERAVGSMAGSLALTLAGALVAGLFLQALLAWKPAWNPVRAEDLCAAPWERRLLQRIMYTLVPLAALVILLLVAVAAVVSYRVATRLVLDQMARDARTVSAQIPFFVQVGRSLIRDLARDERLASDGDQVTSQQLAETMSLIPFFDQLIYFDPQGAVLGAYPPSAGIAVLSAEESARLALALQDGVPGEVVVPAPGSERVVMSFTAVHTEPQSGVVDGVLLGRTTLETNPILTPVIDVLRGGVAGAGEGLIIDDQGRILLYPAHPERQQENLLLDGLRPVPGTVTGQAYRQREPDGTRQVLYLLPISGHSGWSVVLVVPNEVALALALQIAFPLLLVLLGIAGVALSLAGVFMRRFGEPLEHLLQAADLIAGGQLDRPVEVSGEDEIGRLGRAFEQMRVRLASRLSEQERLLNVSRSVSSSLELFRAMPPILSSALDVTGAIGARIVLRAVGSGEKTQTYATGEAATAMALLDSQLLDLVEQQGTIVVSQLWRASGSLDTANLLPRIQALVALPLRSDTSYHGILWLSYDHEHPFEESELTFLSTLAGQAAVAISNARLFAQTEEGRRKLEAVLRSTADGMIVVDSQGRTVLINPAAERYLDLEHDKAIGRKASEVINLPDLAVLMTNLQEPVSTLEIAESNGHTLLANTSTIMGHDGTITGRVAVLRDITAIKRLDTLKTVFLDLVAHDLASPLTYMGGFLSMLQIAGPLNETQLECVQKVTEGVNRLRHLHGRLKNLSQLQLRDDPVLELRLLDVQATIEAVCQQQQEEAKAKGIALRVEYAPNLPPLLADSVMFEHAVLNLVSNAIKYTNQGHVLVRAYVEDADKLTVSVADTGVGIPREHQARVGEPFYRVGPQAGEPEHPPGSGLGLALVRSIATVHHGSLRFESEYGKGSTFYLTLPLRNPRDM
jgi:two-component system phosphate regulon sensor histidine kinase PhoR